MTAAGEVDTWTESTVAAEFDVQLGKRLDAAVNRGELRRCINNRAVRWGHILVSEAVLAPLTKADIHDLRLATGDVLVCEGGEVGRASVWKDDLPEAYFINTLHRLRSKGRYKPQLLVAFFEWWATTGEFSAFVGKSSLAHLTKENLLRVRIPMPPPTEQDHIVDALAPVDDLIAAIERSITKKQAIKQGMMQQLLTGHTRLPGFTSPWSVQSIGDFAEVKAGGTPSTAVSRYWGGDIRWMSSGEVHQKRVREARGRITADGLRESSAQMLQVGSVLIALAGQGKTRGTVAISEVELSTNQSIAGILPSNKHDSDFLYYNLDARYDELRGESAGEGGRGGLNLTIIKKLKVSMPEVPEQAAIARVLADADSELASLRARLDKTRDIKTGMMQHLLSGRIRFPVQESVP